MSQLKFGQGRNQRISVNPQIVSSGNKVSINAVGFDANTELIIRIFNPKRELIFEHKAKTDNDGSIGYLDHSWVAQENQPQGEYVVEVSGKANSKMEKLAKPFFIES